ncbi:MAG TPA: adenylosuccinate lyase, partial [Saprospiraceae bacterium]|nr:adenylosuccinate lyase [Saprospiraceae bacterium]
MIENEIQSLSPLDGRYRTKTLELRAFFSEYALIKYRVKVEVAYLLSLQGILSTTPYSFDLPANLTESLVDNFSEQDAEWIKAKEQVTNHDVKAVEYFIKTRLVESSHSAIAEWV